MCLLSCVYSASLTVYVCVCIPYGFLFFLHKKKLSHAKCTVIRRRVGALAVRVCTAVLARGGGGERKRKTERGTGDMCYSVIVNSFLKRWEDEDGSQGATKKKKRNGKTVRPHSFF